MNEKQKIFTDEQAEDHFALNRSKMYLAQKHGLSKSSKWRRRESGQHIRGWLAEDLFKARLADRLAHHFGSSYNLACMILAACPEDFWQNCFDQFKSDQAVTASVSVTDRHLVRCTFGSIGPQDVGYIYDDSEFTPDTSLPTENNRGSHFEFYVASFIERFQYDLKTSA